MLLWEINFVFMKILFIVLLLQHGRCEHTLILSFSSFAVYTFEDAAHLMDFSASPTSTLELSTERYKDGAHSLKWTWASGDEITHLISVRLTTYREDICLQTFFLLFK